MPLSAVQHITPAQYGRSHPAANKEKHMSPKAKRHVRS